MGHVEERVLAKTGKELELSTKQLVDCTMWSCAGGYPFGALNNMANNANFAGGIFTAASYPMPSKCQKDTCGSYAHGIPSGVVVSSPAQVGKSTECLINALLTGSVVAQINTMPNSVYSWQQYSSGILTGPTDVTTTDHGVLVVGYYIGSGTHYFTIKNSWGSSWGESGFIRIGMSNAGVGQFSIFNNNLGAAQVSYKAAAFVVV
jgi:KDEL-tailed cysteine endopeptidase